MILIIVTLVLTYVLVNKILEWRKSAKFGCKLVPNYHFDWTFGFSILPAILKASKEGRILEFSEEMFPAHQDTIKLRLCGTEIIATTNPENVKHVLATQFQDFDLGFRTSVMIPLLGEGVFTLDGTGWKHSRTMLRPQFAREQVSHVNMLEPHVAALVRHIKSNSGQFDLQELFFRLTMDSATEFLFGESVLTLSNTPPDDDFPERLQFNDAFNKSQLHLSKRFALQNLYWLHNNSEFKKVNAIVHKFSDHYINLALNLSPEELEKKRYIFLYELVKETRDPKVLRDQALNILLAGRDTTAGTLSCAFLELGRNPEIVKKLKQEIQENFGNSIEDLSFESLKKLTYLKAFVNEVLRLYPSVPRNVRAANKDTYLVKGGGPDGQDPVFVKKGRSVVYSVYYMHRSKEMYGEDAEEFRPERWFEERVKSIGWGYLPFNGGPRICLGQQYALTEVSYVIVRLLQSFDHIQSHKEEYPPLKDNNITLALHKTLPMTMS